jgi:hypothetical protein
MRALVRRFFPMQRRQLRCQQDLVLLLRWHRKRNHDRNCRRHVDEQRREVRHGSCPVGEHKRKRSSEQTIMNNASCKKHTANRENMLNIGTNYGNSNNSNNDNVNKMMKFRCRMSSMAKRERRR